MQAFLNELSLPTLHTSEQVIEVFENFGEYYQRARVSGIRDIKISYSFYQHEFAPAFRFFNWSGDGRVDRDLSTLLKSVFGTLPDANEILIKYENENNSVLAMTFAGAPCIGLGLASDALFNSISISFNEQIWSQPNYNVNITIVTEDLNGNLVEGAIVGNNKNITSIPHVLVHQQFINDQVTNTIQNGTELWFRRGELFPNLRFCASTQLQLQSINNTQVEFRQIVQRLYDLQNVASNLNGNPITPQHFPTLTTPESQSRLNRLANQLTITCPDGNDRLFNWHSRFTPGAGRIYFIAYEERNEVLVGSIGKKIP